MIFQNLFIGFLKAYQWVVAPIFMSLGVQCRFNPSCSHYFVDAVKMHGIFKGSFLGICRLLRCHPLCKGGDDFVPEKLELCRK